MAVGVGPGDVRVGVGVGGLAPAGSFAIGIRNGSPVRVSITDAAVGCEIAYIAVRGGTWNVLVNLKDIKDPGYVNEMRTKCNALLKNAKSLRAENETEIDAKL